MPSLFPGKRKGEEDKKSSVELAELLLHPERPEDAKSAEEEPWESWK